MYSLGVTLYVLLSGHTPFQGTTAQKIMQHQLAEPPRLNKLKGKVPPGLIDVITKMMAKDRNERYQTAEDVIDALSPWLPAPTSGNVVGMPLDSQELQMTTSMFDGSPQRSTQQIKTKSGSKPGKKAGKKGARESLSTRILQRV